MRACAANEQLENIVHSLERTAGELSRQIAALKEALSVCGLQPDRPAARDIPDQTASDPWPLGGLANGSGEAGRLARIAKRLRERWTGVTVRSELSVGPLQVDLSSPAGRWQLLILAVLRGARVRERSVEETFVALVERGLTDLERLAAGGFRTKKELLAVLAAHYRALTSREAKAEALMANAALLKREYGGDLHNLYLATANDPEALNEELRRFKQVGQVAHWICRTLKVHGVWPDLGPEATRYLDRYTDLPLDRLAIRVPFDEERPGSTAMRFSADHLGGDTVPLYLQGSILCSQNDVSVCRAECPVVAECPYARKSE